MQTVTAHISRRCRPFVASAVPVLLLALLSPAATASGQQASSAQFTQTRTTAHRAVVPASYGWPVKPFNRQQHPVRGYLNDPRPSDDARIKSFHFGIDISAPTAPRSTPSQPERSSLLAAAAQSRSRERPGHSATGTSCRSCEITNRSASTNSWDTCCAESTMSISPSATRSTT